jgi:cysteine synthase A
VTAVAISPDLGERYLDSVYQHEWVEQNYGSPALV